MGTFKSNSQWQLICARRWQSRARRRYCNHMTLISPNEEDKMQMYRNRQSLCRLHLAPRPSHSKLKINSFQHHQQPLMVVSLILLSASLLLSPSPPLVFAQLDDQSSSTRFSLVPEPTSASTPAENLTKEHHHYQEQMTSSKSHSNNNNNQEPSSDEHSSEFKYILTLVYLIIFIIGVCGNICNCLVIADSRNRYMKTATNYYLFSLSISDLLLLTFGLPHDIVNLWYPSPYLFSSFVCISRGWISEASTYASVLVIVAFTVERYLAICHPLRAHTLSRLSRSVKIIIIIWLVASSCALVVVWQFGIQETIVETLVDVKELSSSSSGGGGVADITVTLAPAATTTAAALVKASGAGPANFENSSANFLVASTSLSTVASIAPRDGNLMTAPIAPSAGGAHALGHTNPPVIIEQAENNYHNNNIDSSLVRYKNNTSHRVVQRKSIAQCTTVALNEKIFELSVLIFFILPMTIITILYMKLGCYLRQKTTLIKQNRLNRERNMSQRNHQHQNQLINDKNNGNSKNSHNNNHTTEESSNNNYNTNLSRSSNSQNSIFPGLIETTTAFVRPHISDGLYAKRVQQRASKLSSTMGNKSIELGDLSSDQTHDATLTMLIKRCPNGNQASSKVTGSNNSLQKSAKSVAKSNSSKKRQPIEIKVTSDDGQVPRSAGDFRDQVKRGAMSIALCCVHSERQVDTTAQQRIPMNKSICQNKLAELPERGAVSASGKQLINQQSRGEQTNSEPTVLTTADGSSSHAPREFPLANNVQRIQERKLINQQRSSTSECVDEKLRKSVNEKSTFNRLYDHDFVDGEASKLLTCDKPGDDHHGMHRVGHPVSSCLINCEGAEDGTVQITNGVPPQIGSRGQKSMTTEPRQQIVSVLRDNSTNGTIQMTNDCDINLTREHESTLGVDLDQKGLKKKKQPEIKGSEDNIESFEVETLENNSLAPLSSSAFSPDNCHPNAQLHQNRAVANFTAKQSSGALCRPAGGDRLSSLVLVDIEKDTKGEQARRGLDRQRLDLEAELEDGKSAYRVLEGSSDNRLARTKTLDSQVANDAIDADTFQIASHRATDQAIQHKSSLKGGRLSISMNELKSNQSSPMMKTSQPSLIKQNDTRHMQQPSKQNHHLASSMTPNSQVSNSKRHSSGFALNSTVNTSSMQSVIKMLVSVVVMFFICWAPFHAQRLMAIYVREPTNEQVIVFNLLNHISGVSYYISAVANPILYSIIGQQVQGEEDAGSSSKGASSRASPLAHMLTSGGEKKVTNSSRHHSGSPKQVGDRVGFGRVPKRSESGSSHHDSGYGGRGDNGAEEYGRRGNNGAEEYGRRGHYRSEYGNTSEHKLDLASASSMLEDKINALKDFVNLIKTKSIAPDRALTLPLEDALFCGKVMLLELWDVIPGQDFPYHCCLLPFAQEIMPPCRSNHWSPKTTTQAPIIPSISIKPLKATSVPSKHRPAITARRPPTKQHITTTSTERPSTKQPSGSKKPKMLNLKAPSSPPPPPPPPPPVRHSTRGPADDSATKDANLHKPHRKRRLTTKMPTTPSPPETTTTTTTTTATPDATTQGPL